MEMLIIDFAVNINELELFSRQFPWAIGTLALMAFVGIIIKFIQFRISDNSGG